MADIITPGSGKKILFWLGMLVVVIIGSVIANHLVKFNVFNLQGQKVGEQTPTLNTGTAGTADDAYNKPNG